MLTLILRTKNRPEIPDGFCLFKIKKLIHFLCISNKLCQTAVCKRVFQ